MEKLKVPFARPYFSAEDIRELKGKLELILKSGQLTSGPFVRELEGSFAQFVGLKHSVAVNSATAGLLGILKALGISAGDEVIVPSNTFVATAGVVVQAGARPVFADCELDTFNISPDSVRDRLSERTRAVIAVHVAGNPCDMHDLVEICGKHHLKLIEDCAHAHGASLDRQPCGSFGDAGCFSFYPTKLVTTGEGGMVVTEDSELADKVRVLRNHGRRSFGPAEVVEIGYNFRMTEIAAAIGISQLAHLPDFVRERNLLAQEYTDTLNRLGGCVPQTITKGALCSYYAYITRISGNRLTRDSVVRELSQRGIETSVIYRPVHLQPAYRAFVAEEQRKTLRNSETIGETSLALPMFNGMSMNELAIVTDAMAEVMKH